MGMARGQRRALWTLPEWAEMVLRSPPEDPEVPCPCDSHCWGRGQEPAEGGVQSVPLLPGDVGGGGGQLSVGNQPLVSRTMARMGVTMALEVIDLWDQDISQFETQFKKNRCFPFSGVWLKKEK